MSHGNAVSDIALVFNQAEDSLYKSGSKDSTSFDLLPAIDSVREPFIKFCKAHEKRLRLCVPCQRVNQGCQCGSVQASEVFESKELSRGASTQ
jgi:hypothetical protein